MLYHAVSCCILLYHVAYRRFEMCCAGRKPRGVKTFEQLTGICDALVIVEAAVDKSSCMPCDANPYNLLCRCKRGRKLGVCSHIMFVTHLIMKAGPKEDRKAINNLSYVTGQIAGAKKGAVRPKRIKHCLQKDSSDEEEEAPAQLMLTW